MSDDQNHLPHMRLIDLAQMVGYHRAGLNRALASRGFTPYKLKEQPNAPLFLSREDAARFIKCIEDEKNLVFRPSYAEPVNTGISAVYALHIPSFTDRQRLKIGWSDNLKERLNTHRSLVPDLRIMAIWITAYV